MTLALFGCGGGDDEATISKAEFVKKANALCATSQKKMQSQFEKELKDLASVKDPGDQEQLFSAVVENAIVPGFESEISGIEELGTPPGDETQVEAVLAPMQEIVTDAKADPKAFLTGAEKAYQKSEKAAQEYGIPACGTPNKPKT